MMYPVISQAYFELMKLKVAVDKIEDAMFRNAPLGKFYDSLCLTSAPTGTVRLILKWRR